MDIPPAPQLSIIGNIDLICPNCEDQLPDLDLDMFLCPSCMQLVFWISRPIDNTRVYLTESQAEEIRQQRWMVEGDYVAKMALQKIEDARFERERQQLKWKTGTLPNSNSIRIYILFQDMEAQRNMGNWHTYSKSLQEIGILCTKNQQYRDALIWFYEHIFINLHGPTDMKGNEENKDLKPFDRFNPGPVRESLQMAMLVAEKGKISEEEVRDCFYQAITAGEKYIPNPMFPIEAWKVIKEKLEMVTPT